jgi:hypothetical protein
VAVDDAGQGGAGDAELPRGIGHGQTQGWQDAYRKVSPGWGGLCMRPIFVSWWSSW